MQEVDDSRVDDWSSDEENKPEVSPNDVNIYYVVPLEENEEEKVLEKTTVEKSRQKKTLLKRKGMKNRRQSYFLKKVTE